jgi:putative drug exporter of the RND superfamily
VFGLSMDYEVFLVSRIHEEWVRMRDHSLAVREGLAATGRVITAAAAIMIVVFAAFMLTPSRMLQQFGLGLAVAILLDAVVIRCLIVPAVLQLFGARTWWPGRR